MIRKKELRAFKELTLEGPTNASNLAQLAETSESYMTKILKELSEKGLIKKARKGKSMISQVAETEHATTLQKIINNNPNSNLEYITNKGINILSTLACMNIKSVEELIEASDVSYATTWKYLDKARGIGLVEKRDGIRINPRYAQVRKFVITFTRYINETEARKHADDALIKWSYVDEYLFETQENLDLQTTGISAFHEYGALFLTSRNLYTSSEKELFLEDHLINHILSEGTENTLPLLITWRLNQDTIDQHYLAKRARRLKASEITEAVQRYLYTNGKDKTDYIINWTEFNEKYMEYQR